MPTGETRMKRSERLLYGLIDKLTQRFYFYFELEEGENELKDMNLQALSSKIGYLINVTITLSKHHGLELRLENLEKELANPIPEYVRKQFESNPDILTKTAEEEQIGV